MAQLIDTAVAPMFANQQWKPLDPKLVAFAGEVDALVLLHLLVPSSANFQRLTRAWGLVSDVPDQTTRIRDDGQKQDEPTIDEGK